MIRKQATKKTRHPLCIYVWKKVGRQKYRWHRIFHNCPRYCTCPRPKNPKGNEQIYPGTIFRVPCLPKKGIVLYCTFQEEMGTWADGVDMCDNDPDYECPGEPDFLPSHEGQVEKVPCEKINSKKGQKAKRKKGT